MSLGRLFPPLTILLLAACGNEPSDRPNQGVYVALADSVRFQNELIGVGYLRRVAVYTGATADTLEGILTEQEPVIAGDSVVYGLGYDQQAVTQGFVYDVRTRRVRHLTLPDQLFPFATPRLSPDGSHLAYLAMDTAGRGYGAVAAWPSARVVYRGQPVRMLETDATVDAVRWLDPNIFEIRIEMSSSVGGGAQRIRGSVAALDATVVDTIGR